MSRGLESVGGGLRVVQISDTHLFADPAARLAGSTPAAGFERVVQAVEQGPEPDAVVVTGDLTDDGSEAGYRRLRRRLERLAPRVFVIPGNHDVPSRMAPIYAAQPVQWVAESAIGDWQFIFLNSVRVNRTGGALGSEQLQDLERRLAEGPDRPALVAVHHQPVPVGAPWLDGIGLSDGEALVECLGRHSRVRGLIWGHIHQAYDATRGPLRLLASPATSVQFRPGARTFALDDQSPGYRWLELAPSGEIATEVVRVDRGGGAPAS